MSSTFSFQHSVQVPRIYKDASKILRLVETEGGSLKDLVFNHNKHSNIKGLHALIAKSIQYRRLINRLLKQSRLLVLEDRFNPWLARILVTELIFGKKTLPGNSKPVLTIEKYKDAILKELEAADIHNLFSKGDFNRVPKRPRFVRINTLKISTEDAVRRFTDEGWTELARPDTYDGFLRLIEERMFEEEYVFVRDFHVNDMLVFPKGVVFYDHPAYINRCIILQDKGSCLSACCVQPPNGSVILDMCSGPGMKTSLYAALIGNEGKIYAVERNQERFETMKTLLSEFGVTCTKLINNDAGLIGPDMCKDVEYIIVDPSCSGSGMSRIEDLELKERENYGANLEKQIRLQQLANLQGYLLRHAVSNFQSARYVIYSTCSVHQEENEAVVESVLTCAMLNGFTLIDLKKYIRGWKNFGSMDYECGKKCLYSRVETDYTNGGFLAIFERTLEVVPAEKESLAAENEDGEVQEVKVKLSEQFFVRINTLKISVDDAIQQFVDNGWNHLPAPNNYQIFISGFHEDPNGEKAKERFFEQDFHIAELLIFPMGIIDTLSSKFIRKKKFILQDKASCLAVHLLDPPPGSTVLNISAGREKSTQFMAARMENRGTIYAYEPIPWIYKNLVSDLQREGVTCARTVLDSGMNSNNFNCPGVEYILVNPDSTGSGVKSSDKSDSSKRPAVLKDFTLRQFSILRHALVEFPGAKRIVYTTKSIHAEENEEIVNALIVVAKFQGFRLVDCPERVEGWKNEGRLKYHCGQKCLIAQRDTGITKGFFIAVFEKDYQLQMTKRITEENHNNRKSVSKTMKERHYYSEDVGGEDKEEELGKGKVSEDSRKEYDDRDRTIDKTIDRKSQLNYLFPGKENSSRKNESDEDNFRNMVEKEKEDDFQRDDERNNDEDDKMVPAEEEPRKDYSLPKENSKNTDNKSDRTSVPHKKITRATVEEIRIDSDDDNDDVRKMSASEFSIVNEKSRRKNVVVKERQKSTVEQLEESVQFAEEEAHEISMAIKNTWKRLTQSANELTDTVLEYLENKVEQTDSEDGVLNTLNPLVHSLMESRYNESKETRKEKTKKKRRKNFEGDDDVDEVTYEYEGLKSALNKRSHEVDKDVSEIGNENEIPILKMTKKHRKKNKTLTDPDFGGFHMEQDETSLNIFNDNATEETRMFHDSNKSHHRRFKSKIRCKEGEELEEDIAEVSRRVDVVNTAYAPIDKGRLKRKKRKRTDEVQDTDLCLVEVETDETSKNREERALKRMSMRKKKKSGSEDHELGEIGLEGLKRSKKMNKASDLETDVSSTKTDKSKSVSKHMKKKRIPQDLYCDDAVEEETLEEREGGGGKIKKKKKKKHRDNDEGEDIFFGKTAESTYAPVISKDVTFSTQDKGSGYVLNEKSRTDKDGSVISNEIPKREKSKTRRKKIGCVETPAVKHKLKKKKKQEKRKKKRLYEC